MEKDDLALIVTGLPATAAAVFTQNRVQAAPVRLGRRHLQASKGLVGAMVINAGNANCATRTGDAVALATCKAAAKLLRLPVTQVLPSSTGVIGVELDVRKIIDALPRLVAGLEPGWFRQAARAIMTTDLVPKTAFAEVKLRRGTVRVAGMTKGSGMIQPLMATTLGFVMTDAQIPVARSCAPSSSAAWSAATTASPWMAIPPPTTRCCCWPTALPACGPTPRKWPRSEAPSSA